MPDTEHDHISRQTGMVLRTGLQVAMQVAEALARRREQQARAAAAAADARSRALTARLTAERRSAEAYLRRTADRRWWANANDAQIVEAVRIAHTWKNDSPAAERAVDRIAERLRRDKGVDLPGLRDVVATAAVAVAVERELAARADRERLADEYAERGHPVSGEAPHGLDYVPARHLATVEGAEYGSHLVDDATIADNPSLWAVHVASGPDGHPTAEFFCTDPSAAGLHRRPPTPADVWDEQWLASADEPQLRQLRTVLVDSGAVDAVPRLDATVLDRRDIDLTRPPDQIGRTVTDAMGWAETNVPADVARYRSNDPKARAVGEESIRLAFDTHHARAWATDHAPALAVSFADAAHQPDRQTYLTARDDLIEQWNDAGRPAVEVVTAGRGSSPDTDPEPSVPENTPTLAWDSPQRRERDANALTASGVSPDAVQAHMLTDTSNAVPLDTATLHTPTHPPSAIPGERATEIDRSQDRGDR